MNNDNNGREFLKFVSELLNFISQYDKMQLSRFHSMSGEKFQYIGNVIQDMIKLMEYPEIKTLKLPIETKQNLEEAKNLTELEEQLRMLLSSKENLKKTQDVVDFAYKSLGVKINKGHRTRNDIIDKILGEVKKKSDHEKIKIGRALKKMNKHLQDDNSEDFFSGWEKVIKSIEL